MQKSIGLRQGRITYTLRKSQRARRMRLAVYCDGSVVVTTPFDLQESMAEKFIREKSSWLFLKLEFFNQFKGKAISRRGHDDYLQYKDKAYEIALDRVNHFNQQYKFSYNRINIKNQKTRWGSCSKKGNLNFNYKIAFLPQRLIDYIVVHELCHLGEFNHSRKFWSLVGKTFADYKEIRREMAAWMM